MFGGLCCSLALLTQSGLAWKIRSDPTLWNYQQAAYCFGLAGFIAWIYALRAALRSLGVRLLRDRPHYRPALSFEQIMFTGGGFFVMGALLLGLFRT